MVVMNMWNKEDGRFLYPFILPFFYDYANWKDGRKALRPALPSRQGDDTISSNRKHNRSNENDDNNDNDDTAPIVSYGIATDSTDWYL